MALFAAFTTAAPGSPDLALDEKKQQWLHNSSFPKTNETNTETVKKQSLHSIEDVQKTAPGQSVQGTKKHDQPAEKQKREKKKRKLSSESCETESINDDDIAADDYFIIDRTMDLKNLKIAKKILKTTVCSEETSNKTKPRKKSKKDRYFNRKHLLSNEIIETEVTSFTESFNKKLASDPHDIAIWIQYIDYQDGVESRRLIKSAQANAQRKLSIVEKALFHNAGSDILLEKWITVAKDLYPTEELCSEIYKLIDSKKHGNDLVLWLGLINATQCSLTHCSVTSVLGKFKQAIEVLQQQRLRAGREEITTIEHSIVGLLLHCAMFLSSAGLTEQRLMLLKLYLDLNFGNDIFNLNCESSALELQSLEDIILESGLPLPQIWTRIETLRQNIEIMPDPSSTSVDPQRIVLVEDFSPLVYHVAPQYQFTLLCAVLISLNVPLLPLSDCLAHRFTFDKRPLASDNIELALSAALPHVCFEVDPRCLQPLLDLLTGPQYLNRAPGQCTYFQLISKIFLTSWNGFSISEKNALTLWWLRFNRWLAHLHRSGIIDIPSVDERIELLFMNALEAAENRSNLLLYREYAFLQRDKKQQQKCIKILQKTLKSSPDSSTICRALIEETSTNHRDIVFSCVQKLSHCDDPVNSCKILCNTVDLNITNLTKAEAMTDELMLPCHTVDLAACCAWLMAYCDSVPQALRYLRKLIDVLKVVEGSQAARIREELGEVIATIMWKLMPDGQELKSHLRDQSLLFPYNITFTAFTTSLELKKNSFWLRFVADFPGSTSINAIIGACIAQYCAQQKNIDGQDGANTRVLNYQNRVSKCSVIVKRMMLASHAEHRGSIELELMTVIEEYPWVKAVYMDGVALSPGQLSQLTDLMVEKELRVHVMPDEIDALRS